MTYFYDYYEDVIMGVGFLLLSENQNQLSQITNISLLNFLDTQGLEESAICMYEVELGFDINDFMIKLNASGFNFTQTNFK